MPAFLPSIIPRRFMGVEQKDLIFPTSSAAGEQGEGGGGKRKGRSGSNFPLVSPPLKLFLCEYNWLYTLGKERSVVRN